MLRAWNRRRAVCAECVSHIEYVGFLSNDYAIKQSLGTMLDIYSPVCYKTDDDDLLMLWENLVGIREDNSPAEAELYKTFAYTHLDI